MNKLMKFGFAVLAVVFSIASCSETTAQSKELAQEVVKTNKMVMTIDGMTCVMGCARAIEVELKNIEGVEKAIVDFKSTTANVVYNSTLTSETALLDFVNNYRNGAFKASIAAAKKCGADCTKPCCAKAKKACCASKKKACSAEQKAKCDKESKKSCSDADKAKCGKGSKKSCCASKKVEKTCKADCTKSCCAKEDAKKCGAECTKPCCDK